MLRGQLPASAAAAAALLPERGVHPSLEADVESMLAGAQTAVVAVAEDDGGGGSDAIVVIIRRLDPIPLTVKDRD